jgi:hypothetical protein
MKVTTTQGHEIFLKQEIFEGLKMRLRGPLFLPGYVGYEESRTVLGFISLTGITGLMIVMLIFINGCNDKKQSSEAVFSITGTVTWKPLETGFYTIDADDGKKYEPINLPDEFAMDGLKVRVTARSLDDMASINMYGIIIEIILIEKL